MITHLHEPSGIHEVLSLYCSVLFGTAGFNAFAISGRSAPSGRSRTASSIAVRACSGIRLGKGYFLLCCVCRHRRNKNYRRN